MHTNLHECAHPCLCCPASVANSVSSATDVKKRTETVRDEECRTMALKRRDTPVGMGPASGPVWEDPEFKAEYPNLHAFLFDSLYDDGTRRLTGSISIFTKGGVLTAAVNDNDRKVSAFVKGATWAELLFYIDEGIKADSLEWRSKTPNGNTTQPPF